MKASIMSLAIVAGVATAQSASGIPECARPCLAQYTSGNTIAGCKQLEIKCICSNSAFLSGIACCIKNACDAAAQAATINYAKTICSGVGVATPDKVECTTGASSQHTAATTSSAAPVSGSATTATSVATTNPPSAGTNSTASHTGTASSTAPAGSSSAAANTFGTPSGLFGALVAMILAL